MLDLDVTVHVACRFSYLPPLCNTASLLRHTDGNLFSVCMLFFFIPFALLADVVVFVTLIMYLRARCLCLLGCHKSACIETKTWKMLLFYIPYKYTHTYTVFGILWKLGWTGLFRCYYMSSYCQMLCQMYSDIHHTNCQL